MTTRTRTAQNLKTLRLLVALLILLAVIGLLSNSWGAALVLLALAGLTPALLDIQRSLQRIAKSVEDPQA
ncbi:hypothetical protein [Deinococcus sonorensis]|uniref:DUF2892 domain-containing protein n=1 Tax=Deinococcus sonorensis TaxID=309891 RepID=A0ABV8Y898_9DEIO